MERINPNNNFPRECFPSAVSPIHPAGHAARPGMAPELSKILAELEAYADRLEHSNPNLSMAISIAISLIELNNAETEQKDGEDEV